jgi:CHRD domain
MKRAIQSTLFLLVCLLLIPVANAQKTKTSFVANLAGKDQVPPVETHATGRATFRLSKNGKDLSYTLNVKGIDDVTMAHIHMAPMGKDGPPVVWLYGDKMHPAKKMGMVSGMLARGTITEADLVGSMKGKPLSDLVKEIRDGDTYVNVHTKGHPAGEIRGQIE